jgi:hypothetical protein
VSLDVFCPACSLDRPQPAETGSGDAAHPVQMVTLGEDRQRVPARSRS